MLAEQRPHMLGAALTEASVDRFCPTPIGMADNSDAQALVENLCNLVQRLYIDDEMSKFFCLGGSQLGGSASSGPISPSSYALALVIP